MMIDLRGTSEEVLLEDIHTRVKLLLKAVNKYLAYKIFSTKDDVTCGELATETNDVHELLTALTEYLDKEQIKQDIFKLLNEEAAKLRESKDEI